MSDIVGPYRGDGFRLVFSVTSSHPDGDEDAICPACNEVKKEAQIHCGTVSVYMCIVAL